MFKIFFRAVLSPSNSIRWGMGMKICLKPMLVAWILSLMSLDAGMIRITNFTVSKVDEEHFRLRMAVIAQGSQIKSLLIKGIEVRTRDDVMPGFTLIGSQLFPTASDSSYGVLDNGPSDEEPLAGAFALTFSVKGWKPGEYRFCSTVHNRPPFPSPYTADMREFSVVVGADGGMSRVVENAVKGWLEGYSFTNGKGNQALPPACAGWGATERKAQRKRGEEMMESLAIAVAAGQPSFTIPPGDYRFSKRGLLTASITNMTIEAKGAVFYIEQINFGLELYQCKNMTLRGLSLDYDPLPYSQGHIVAIDEASETIDFKVDEGFLPPTILFKDPVTRETRGPLNVMFFDGATKLVRTIYYSSAKKAEELGEGRFRLSVRKIRLPDENTVVDYRESGLRPGDTMTLLCRNANPAFQLLDCEGVTLEDIFVYASPGAGFLESQNSPRESGGNIYRHCRIIPRPQTSRVMATDADGFHSVNMARGPTIEQCETFGIGDDSVNIRGTLGLVTSVSGSRLVYTCRMRSEANVLAPGALLSFIDPDSGAILGERKIRAVADLPVYDGYLRWVAQIKKDLAPKVFLDHRPLQIDLDSDLPVPPGTVVIQGGHCGEGAVIRSNYFHDSVARGIVIQSHNTLVEHNIVERYTGNALNVFMQLQWLEGGTISNILIRENTFIDSLGTTTKGIASQKRFAMVNVVVDPFDGHPLPTASTISDIQLVRNRFVRPKAAALLIANASNVIVLGNSIRDPASMGAPGAGAALGVRGNFGIALLNSRQVILSNNTFGGDCRSMPGKFFEGTNCYGVSVAP